jgi:hypothetical protein
MPVDYGTTALYQSYALHEALTGLANGYSIVRDTYRSNQWKKTDINEVAFRYMPDHPIKAALRKYVDDHSTLMTRSMIASESFTLRHQAIVAHLESLPTGLLGYTRRPIIHPILSEAASRGFAIRRIATPSANTSLTLLELQDGFLQREGGKWLAELPRPIAVEVSVPITRTGITVQPGPFMTDSNGLLVFKPVVYQEKWEDDFGFSNVEQISQMYPLTWSSPDSTHQLIENIAAFLNARYFEIILLKEIQFGIADLIQYSERHF